MQGNNIAGENIVQTSAIWNNALLQPGVIDTVADGKSLQARRDGLANDTMADNTHATARKQTLETITNRRDGREYILHH